MTSGYTLMSCFMSIMFPKDAVYSDRFDRGMKAFISGGVDRKWDNLFRFWKKWRVARTHGSTQLHQYVEGRQKMTFGLLREVFMVWGEGVALSFGAFFVELIWKRFRFDYI